MFHRVLVEEWQRVLTIASFTIFGVVFLLTLVRVARMPRRSLEHLENLPLLDEQQTSSK